MWHLSPLLPPPPNISLFSPLSPYFSMPFHLYLIWELTAHFMCLGFGGKHNILCALGLGLNITYYVSMVWELAADFMCLVFRNYLHIFCVYSLGVRSQFYASRAGELTVHFICLGSGK